MAAKQNKLFKVCKFRRKDTSSGKETAIRINRFLFMKSSASDKVGVKIIT